MKVSTSGLSQLDEAGKLKIEALTEQYTKVGDMMSIQGFANLDTTDEEEVPSGMVSIYHADAEINTDSIPEKSFNFLVVCPIKQRKNKTYTDADFVISEKLHEAVPQYSDKPPTVHTMSSEVRDQKPWNAELGEDGFAGIFKQVKENGRSADYFIAVQAGVPNACSELKDYISTNKGMTFEDLVNDPKYSYVKHLAQRNAQRLAYNVARAFKVEIEHIDDVSSCLNTHYMGQPKRANGHQQAQSTIRLLPQGYRGKDAVAVYHNVTPIDDAYDTCYVSSNPYDGIAKFNMNGNGNGIGLPANAGRKTTTQNLTDLDSETLKKRSEGLTWENQKKDTQHPDIHPDSHNTIDANFLEHMKELGWKQEGTNNREYLVPVAVKITNPSLIRQ